MYRPCVQGGKRSGKLYTSRCHVHDICQVLMASMAAPEPGSVYNVADDDPASRETVLEYVRARFREPMASSQVAPEVKTKPADRKSGRYSSILG